MMKNVNDERLLIDTAMSVKNSLEWDTSRAVKQIYGRSLQWFLRTYNCYKAVENSSFPFLTTTSMWPLDILKPRIVCAGPCLDHALPSGSSEVSFQIAVETVFWLTYVNKNKYPLLLFVMGGEEINKDLNLIWEKLHQSYLGMVFDMCSTFEIPFDSVHVEPTWRRPLLWREMRQEFAVAVNHPLFCSMYQPAKALHCHNSKQLSSSLTLAYHNNLLAYHPLLIQQVSPWKIKYIQHVENLQQLRAYFAASRIFSLNSEKNAHTSFMPMPSQSGSIRLTRATGESRLPARLGFDKIRRAVCENKLLKSYLLAHLDAEILETIINLFVKNFTKL